MPRPDRLLKLLDIERPDFDPAFRGQDQREGTASRLVVEQEEPETTTDSMKELLEP